MSEGDGERLVGGEIDAGGDGGRSVVVVIIVIVVGVLVGLANIAGKRVDLVVIFKARGLEFDFVDDRTVVGVEFNFQLRDVFLRHTGVRKGDLLGGCFADVGLFARRAVDLEVSRSGFPRVDQHVQLMDVQLSQLAGRVKRGLVEDFLNQRRLAEGNPVGVGHAAQRVVVVHGLAQHGAVNRFVLQQTGDFGGEALLNLLAALAVRAFDREEHGVRQLVNISVFEHGTDQRVERDVDIRPFQLHAVENADGVLVQRLDFQHGIGAVDLDDNARIDVERDDRVYTVIRLISSVSEAAADKQRQRGGDRRDRGDPFPMCVLFRRHFEHDSFLFSAS